MEYRKEPVIGFEEYQVDTDGVVYGKNGRPLKPSTNPKGYQIVNFLVDGVRTGHSVHTLVATQFLEKPEGATQVNHISGDKTKNNVENLEWVSAKQNSLHSVNVLKNGVGEKNGNAIGVIGADKNGKIIYDVNCMSDAARILAAERNILFKSAETGIWRALNGLRKTYANLYWRYK